MARRKLILVYNPRSSRAAEIEREVVAKIRKVRGLMVGKFEIARANVNKNAKLLSLMLDDGDLVISVGGDGTAAVAVNGILESGKNAVFAPLKFGNFNDCSRMLKVGKLDEIIERFRRKKIAQIYPLEVLVNDKHWRYSPCYVTMGLFAESTQVFDEAEVRAKLQKRKHNLCFSISQLAQWYFKNKQRNFLPKNTQINGKKIKKNTTDLMAVNSRSVAKIMHGGKWYLDPNCFWASTGKLGSFWRLCWFMMRSILFRIPGQENGKLTAEFAKPEEILLHAEGEVELLKQVAKVEIKKSTKPLNVIDFGFML